MGQAETATRHYTPEEYFELEETSEIRHKYFEGEIFAMAGASKSHNVLAQNLAAGLRAALRGRGCQTFMEDVRLVMKENVYYVYPDVLVTCDPADRRDAYLVRHPVLIAEILSPSTAEYDRTKKFANYQKINSLRHYLLVSQTVWVVGWLRRDEAG